MREKETGTLDAGVRALLIFPMNALANDQQKKLRKLLKDYPDITFGRYTGETPHKNDKETVEQAEKRLHDEYSRTHADDSDESQRTAIPNEYMCREMMAETPPHILLTNYAMLEYMLLRPDTAPFFDNASAKNWRFIVIDEAHTYKGANGTEIAFLLRRLKERIRHNMNEDFRCIATSATLGSEDAKPSLAAFAQNLFGEPFDHQFESLWPEVSIGKFADSVKDTDAHVICGSIQSVALNLELFKENDFDYIIIDEAHHASADTYQRVLAYFKPKFTLGLTATPERADDVDILEIFKNTAHKLDIQTAVEIGALVPVRCIRIHTNIDMTKVRFNSVQYNIRDLDVKICVTERNQLIVDTWCEYVKNKRTVVFCASVKHAEQIAELFRSAGVSAVAVSGSMKTSERNEQLAKFASGELKVLCACDLLNEGWDCPETEVLFMARPTMSRVLYTQQLGRGMRTAEGKDHLMVFDFVDNAGQYNMPYSLHRLFKLKEYQGGALVVGKKGQREAEQELYRQGEKPDAVIDYPVDATDFEVVDIFNWQEEAAGMISQLELVRRVDVQSETIERYLREGMLVPDLIVPMSEHRSFKYFREETLESYAEKYGWTLIDDSNRKDLFMDMVRKMDMSYSYKPVLMKAVLTYADSKGRVKLEDIVSYLSTGQIRQFLLFSGQNRPRILQNQ